MPNNGPSATGGEANNATPPRLDPTFFPHIIDMILRCAAYRSLLALRAASKAFKTCVDALLIDHVMVHPWEYRSRGNVSELFLTKGELRRLPELKDGISALANIRVLDVNGALHADLSNGVNDTPLSVKCLRTRANSWFELEYDPFETRVHIHFLLAAPSSLIPESEILTYVPRSLVRTVINVEHDCIDLVEIPGFQLFLVNAELPSAHNLVIISNPHIATTSTVSVHKRCVAGDHAPRKVERSLAQFIACVAGQYWKVSTTCKLTLVGFPLECIAPKLFADGLLPSKEDARLELYKVMSDIHAANPRFSPLSIDLLQKCIERTEILDHETYRRRVGEEAYRLETVW